METKYHAFYVDLPHAHFAVLTKRIIEHYTIQSYLITAEKTSNGIEHYHFLLQCTQNTYAAIMLKLKTDYSLKGKAEKDGRRQYGKLRKIDDIDRLKIYMLKDWKEWKLMVTNIDKKKIELLYSLSFKKNEKLAKTAIFKKQFQDLVKKTIKSFQYYPYLIENSDITSQTSQILTSSHNLEKTLAKCALKIWTIKEELRPPLMKTLLFYARPVLGENTFLEHYYNL